MSSDSSLEPASAFVQRFVARIEGHGGVDQSGTGLLLAPRVVATCRHVVEGLFDDDIQVRFGSRSSRGRWLRWSTEEGEDDDTKDVAFVVLEAPLGPAEGPYPALVRDLTGDLLQALREILPSVRDGLLACGHLPGGPLVTPASIDYGDHDGDERVKRVRLDESHQHGESGGPVWLTPPRRLARRAQDWRPGLVVGLLAKGGLDKPKSFLITSNALIELRDASSGGTMEPSVRQALSSIRVVHAKDVESWLPQLRGEPITRVFDWSTGCWESSSLRTVHVWLPLGSVRLYAYTGTVVEHRVWGAQGSVRGHATTMVNMELFLRLDDGREIHLSSSQKDLDLVPFRPNHSAANPLRAGHRVTLVWATSGRRGMMAACHVYTLRQRLGYPPRYVRYALMSEITMFVWIATTFFLAMGLTFVYSSVYGDLAVLGLVVVLSLFETRAVERAIDSLMQAADLDVAPP